MDKLMRSELVGKVLKPLYGLTVGEAKSILQEAETELDHVIVAVPQLVDSSTNENSQE